MKKISIIIPAYNEEESLPFLIERINKLMNSLEDKYDFEILFINDGSKDRTLELIKEYRDKDKRICYVDFAFLEISSRVMHIIIFIFLCKSSC